MPRDGHPAVGGQCAAITLREGPVVIEFLVQHFPSLGLGQEALELLGAALDNLIQHQLRESRDSIAVDVVVSRHDEYVGLDASNFLRQPVEPLRGAVVLPFLSGKCNVARDDDTVDPFDSSCHLEGSQVRNEAFLDVVVNIDLRARFLAKVNVGQMHVR